MQEQWLLIETILPNLLVSALSASATVIGLYKSFSEKAISHFFERRIEALKHDQNIALEIMRQEHGQSIESLKAEIAHVSDRGVRSNEREFNALTLIWEKYVDLYYATNVCVVDFVQVPDLNKYNDEDLNTYLESTEFGEMQKNHIRRAADKAEAAAKIQSYRNVNAAQYQIYEMNLLLNKLGIFIPASVRECFSKAVELCSAAAAQRFVELGGRHSQMTADLEFLQKGSKLLEELKSSVAAQLMRKSPVG